MNEHLSLASQIVLVPRRAGLCAGRENTVDVLVRVQAPDAPIGKVSTRPTQTIAVVLDRSGSMDGKPLAEAQRCAEFVATRLRSTDAMSVVQFDNRVERLLPATTIGDGGRVRAAIATIQSGGNTNLHGGWLEGAQTLADIPVSGLNRVILLSDGCANEGVTDSQEISSQCAAWAAKGITTSTYGLGRSFNEELMVAMARAGGGNHYYGDTAEDLMEPFEQELDLLANLALRQVVLSAPPLGQLKVTMLNDLPPAGDGWRLPDLAWGAEAWALVQVTIPADALVGLGSSMAVLEVSVCGNTLEGEPVVLERARLALPVLSQAAFDALPEDELVGRRAAEVAAGRMLIRMRAAAEAGDWAVVEEMLADAHRQFAGNEWVAGILAAMAQVVKSRSRERLMKEARYSSAKLQSRLASKDEMAFSMSMADEPAYLRRKSLQGKKDL